MSHPLLGRRRRPTITAKPQGGKHRLVLPNVTLPPQFIRTRLRLRLRRTRLSGSRLASSKRAWHIPHLQCSQPPGTRAGRKPVLSRRNNPPKKCLTVRRSSGCCDTISVSGSFSSAPEATLPEPSLVASESPCNPHKHRARMGNVSERKVHAKTKQKAVPWRHHALAHQQERKQQHWKVRDRHRRPPQPPPPAIHKTTQSTHGGA